MKRDEYITTTIAAKELGLATRTIAQYCKDRLIKAKTMGGMYFISRRDWEEWKARNLKEVS